MLGSWENKDKQDTISVLNIVAEADRSSQHKMIYATTNTGKRHSDRSITEGGWLHFGKNYTYNDHHLLSTRRTIGPTLSNQGCLEIRVILLPGAMPYLARAKTSKIRQPVALHIP